MQDEPRLEIAETREGNWTRVVVRGELDLATAQRLRERLRELKVTNAAVRLDLSDLEFIDSSGAHVLVEEIGHERAQWRVELEPKLSPQVRRFLELMKAAGWKFDL